MRVMIMDGKIEEFKIDFLTIPPKVGQIII
jgi:hypothetical protein